LKALLLPEHQKLESVKSTSNLSIIMVSKAEVDVERLFNIARNILGLRRMSMSAETLRALILLKDYLRRLEVGQV
jgi:hypothetical protein